MSGPESYYAPFCPVLTRTSTPRGLRTVRTGYSFTRTSLLRAARTGGAGQLAPGGPRTVRTRGTLASLGRVVLYVPHRVLWHPPQVLPGRYQAAASHGGDLEEPDGSLPRTCIAVQRPRPGSVQSHRRRVRVSPRVDRPAVREPAAGRRWRGQRALEGRQTDRHTDIQAGRQAGRPAGRQTIRQIDRWSRVARDIQLSIHLYPLEGRRRVAGLESRDGCCAYPGRRPGRLLHHHGDGASSKQ